MILLLEKKFISKKEWEDSTKLLKTVISKKGTVGNFSFCSSEFSHSSTVNAIVTVTVVRIANFY